MSKLHRAWIFGLLLGGSAASENEPSSISFATASIKPVEKATGGRNLKLEPRKIPIDKYVIDGAEKTPAQN